MTALPCPVVVWHGMDMNAPRHPDGTLRLRPREQAQAPPAAPARPDPAEIAQREAANLQCEREAHEAALVRRREQRREVLALLRTRWPVMFSAPVPLAVGIKHEIGEGLGEVRVPSAQLGRARNPGPARRPALEDRARDCTKHIFVLNTSASFPARN